MFATTLLVLFVSSACGLVWYHEPFNDKLRWTQSTARADFGKMDLSSGATYGDASINQGLKTTEDARFYAYSASLGTKVTNDDKDFVLSLAVRHAQGLDCGGGYVKLFPDLDQAAFTSDSEYYLMFGPDQCGYNRRVHIIFNYQGKNLLWKKEPKYPDDKLTHVYTVRVKPDNTYEFYIDKELKESGSLEDDWNFLEPKMIEDPSDKKPADWVDDPTIDDPEDKKPEDWESEPETIVDIEARKPDDWDDEEDGAWEAPQIPNPKYKGEWSPKRIPNPAYKGEWKAKLIANPKYAADPTLYRIPKPLTHVGIDVWQVKSGTIFDNIIIGDNLEEVNAIIDSTWGATKDSEKAAEEAAAKASAPPPKEDVNEEL